MRARLLLTLLVLMLTSAATAHAATPVVSLTFDDAVDLPEPAGTVRDRVDDISWHALHTLPPLKATYYLNSAVVGSRFGFSQATLQQMVAAGDELGGHTVHHLDLARLEDLTELRRQACGDRKALSVMPRLDGGTFEITSFAYPNGDFAWPDASDADPHVIDIISGAAGSGPLFGGCAYSSARATGGVLPTTACVAPTFSTACVLRGLPTLPLDPRLRFRIPTPASIDAANGSARLSTLRNWITAAERAGATTTGAPWLVLVLHHLCAPLADPAAQCTAPHAMRDDDFIGLSDFLKAEQAAGRLSVRTVTTALDAADGTLTKERPLGADAIPATTARTTVLNGGMDLDTPTGTGATAAADGIPDCFDVSNDHVAVAVRQLRQADGSTGAVAQLTVPRGEDQRFTVRPDLGGCVLAVKTGARYRISMQYRLFSAGVDVAPPAASVAPDVAPLALFGFTRSDAFAPLPAPHRYTGRWYAGPGLMPWPVRSGWRTASCVTKNTPAGRDALAPGLELHNADDAPGVAGLRDPVTQAITILVDQVAMVPTTAAATCVG